MVGSIHPLGPYVDDIPHYPVGDLVWIVWDRYRGGKQSDGTALADHCCVCKYVTEWAIDQLWAKWEHDSFMPFGIFINNLINTSMYDYTLGRLNSGELFLLRYFCEGVTQKCFWENIYLFFF